MIFLFRREIEDQHIQTNFERIQTYLNEDTLGKGVFKFFEIFLEDKSGAYPATLKYAHNLNYVPKDVILTNVSSGVTVTFNYDSFDNTNLDITISGATTIRAFIGRYEES